LKAKVKKFLEKLPNTWSVKTNERSVRGIPDYLLCVQGKFIALELKRDEVELMQGTLQCHTLERIARAGGYATFVYPQNFEKVKEDILKLLKGA